jgi:alkanesulfonate monooxygenase SsuD/methylene tetrahydromethanopterin reductase-like flavin-dependent oxidoreductase (luciferase family)
VDTPARFLASLARLSRHAEEAGRDPDELDLAYSVGWYDDPRASMKPEGDRPSFRGTPEQVASDVRAFADLGVRHLMVGFQRPTVEETVERMHRFAEEVIPLAAG